MIRPKFDNVIAKYTVCINSRKYITKFKHILYWFPYYKSVLQYNTVFERIEHTKFWIWREIKKSFSIQILPSSYYN